MGFCKNCGTELSDGAKFCPKCGEQVNQQAKPNEQPKGQLDSLKEGFKEGWQEEINESNNQDQIKGLSIGEKIALAVAGFFSLTGILGGLSDGMWIACIVSLCAMGAICAVFMGKIQKKYAWTTAIVSFLVVMCTIGASLPDEENGKEKQVQAEQKQETPKKEQESTAPQKPDETEQKTGMDKESSIKSLGFSDGVKYGKIDRGDLLTHRVQMGMAMESAFNDLKDIARIAYKEDYDSNISDELLNVYAESYLEGYKSVVLKK